MLHYNSSSGHEIPSSGGTAGSTSTPVVDSGYLNVLFKEMKDCVILIDTDGAIIAMNPAARMLLGLANELEPGAIARFIEADSRKRFEETVKPEAERCGVWYGSVLLQPWSGAPILVSAMLYYHAAEHNVPAFHALIGRPISGAVQGGSVADLPVRFTSRVLGSLRDAVFVVETPSRHITYCNRAAEDMFGYESGQLIGQPTSLLHVDLAHHEEFGRVTRKVLAHSLLYEGEYPMRRSDGKILDTHLSVTVLEDPETNITSVVTIIRDITTDKQAAKAKAVYENQLRALVARLDLMEGQERRNVAAYLHDDVIQTLARARNELSAAASGNLETMHSGIASITELVDEAIGALRGKISELAVPALEELGLNAALECVREQLEAEYGIPIRFVISGNPVRLPPIQRNVLFSGARELVLNALKHANPTHIDVSLVYEPARVEVHVRDNGIGFRAQKEPAMPRSLGGFGLFHLSERLMYVGGRLDVESISALSTTVSFWVPITSNRQGD